MTVANAKIVHIDLTGGQISSEYFPPDLIRKWGGGSGLASWRIFRDLPPGTQPMDPANDVWIIGGPLTGTRAPCSGRVEVVTKSALTGIIGLSSSGGYFGARLKHAGLDGIVLHGASPSPVYIAISKDKIEIKDASHLWGRDTWETEEFLGAELHDPSLKRIKVMSIGPAGENLVRFSCLINERYHAAGRGGVGAVMGSKKVKAVVVDAGEVLAMPANSAFREAADRATKKILDSPSCQKFSRYGSLPFSDGALDTGALPGKNYQTGILPRWKETRGAQAIVPFVTRKEGSCYRCPMPCFNRVEIPEGNYKGLKIASGTFVMTIIEFGAKCALESPPAIWKCKEICHRQGLDFCSVSGAISFAMELFQRDLLPREYRDELELAWGNEQATITLLENIALRRGLGDILAEGVSRASKLLGPATLPYAMTIKGMEMMAQDPRTNTRGRAIGALTGSRGDYVRSTHMQADRIPSLTMLQPEQFQEWKSYSETFVSNLDMFPAVKDAIYGVPPLVNPVSFKGKAMLAKWFEDLYAGICAVGLCFFPADKLVLGPTDYGELLATFLETDITPEEFMEIGERIFNIQRLFLVREGISRKDDTLPERFFKEGLPEGAHKGATLSRDTINQVLDEYYDARGWDRTTGYPTPETLCRLGIEERLDFLPAAGTAD